jgi:hypothetical protein
MIVVVRRAARGCVALVGGPAGIASDVSMNTLICGAILDGPYSHTILGGTLASQLRAFVAPRIPTTLVSE